MGSLTCLTDPDAPVVIDTSAAINLIATGCAADIFQALPQQLLAVDTVPAELEAGRRRGRPDANLLHELVLAGHIEIVTLGESSGVIFEELVVGSAVTTLDDGEAATIAYAAGHGAIAIIDERKANRVCTERYPALRRGSTLDLLTHPGVSGALGRDRLAGAVLNALRNARMQVLPQHVEWVVGLIGLGNAATCTSLSRTLRTAGVKFVEQYE